MAEHGEGVQTRDRRRDAGLIVMTLAAVLLIWFVVANHQKVQIHFWVFTANASLITVVVISAALGAVLALLVRRNRSKV